MNPEHETIEILMGKHLDGEISGAEARLLQTHLDQNPDARQLLEQLQDLHRTSRQALTEEVLGRGRSAQDIMDAALQQNQGHRSLRFLRKWVFSQFTAGLAAGLLIATLGALRLNANEGQRPPVRMAQQTGARRSVPAGDSGPALAEWKQPNPRIQRNVDWIVFPDEQGKYWLIEGLREDRRIIPAADQGDF